MPLAGISDTEFVDIPLSQVRKTIARRLVESIGPVPHFFLTIDVDMTRVLEARKRVNALLEARGTKASINDIVLKATAKGRWPWGAPPRRLRPRRPMATSLASASRPFSNPSPPGTGCLGSTSCSPGA